MQTLLSIFRPGLRTATRSPCTASRLLSTSTGRGQRFTLQESELVAQRLKQGISSAAVGAEVGRPAHSIRAYVARVLQHQHPELRVKSRIPNISELVKSILEHLEDGKTLRQIAQELGRGYGSVAHVFQTQKEFCNHWTHCVEWSKDQESQLLKLRGEGKQFKCIALEMQKPLSAVKSKYRTLLASMEVEVKSEKAALNAPQRATVKPKNPNGARKRWSQTETERLMAMYDDKIPMKAIAQKLSRTYAGVVGMIDHQITLRSQRQGLTSVKGRNGVPHEEANELFRLRDEQKLGWKDIAVKMPQRSMEGWRSVYYRLKRRNEPPPKETGAASTPAAQGMFSKKSEP